MNTDLTEGNRGNGEGKIIGIEDLRFEVSKVKACAAYDGKTAETRRAQRNAESRHELHELARIGRKEFSRERAQRTQRQKDGGKKMESPEMNADLTKETKGPKKARSWGQDHKTRIARISTNWVRRT